MQNSHESNHSSHHSRGSSTAQPTVISTSGSEGGTIASLYVIRSQIWMPFNSGGSIGPTAFPQPSEAALQRFPPRQDPTQTSLLLKAAAVTLASDWTLTVAPVTNTGSLIVDTIPTLISTGTVDLSAFPSAVVTGAESAVVGVGYVSAAPTTFPAMFIIAIILLLHAAAR